MKRAFESFDGKIFYSESECDEYEKTLCNKRIKELEDKIEMYQELERECVNWIICYNPKCQQNSDPRKK